MGNRKQPFGYRMELGVIVRHPQEAPLVEQIFRQYLSGVSYNTLVADLRRQLVPYDEGKVWKLILSIAAAQYGAVGNEEYETARLQRVFAQAQPMTELDAELLQSTVSAIQVYGDGSLDLCLKNNQVIGGSTEQ